MPSSGTCLARVCASGGLMELEPYELLNLSQGGMCIRGKRALDEGGVEYFLMDLTEPFESTILVRTEGRWARPERLDNQVMGVSILESSKGWLGVEDAEREDSLAFASDLT